MARPPGSDSGKLFLCRRHPRIGCADPPWAKINSHLRSSSPLLCLEKEETPPPKARGPGDGVCMVLSAIRIALVEVDASAVSLLPEPQGPSGSVRLDDDVGDSRARGSGRSRHGGSLSCSRWACG